MRCYKISYTSTNGSRRYKWAPSQKIAGTGRKMLRREGCKDIITMECDVPTDKVGLVSWLNRNVSHAG